MANPSPQHNPTDGLGTPNQITVTTNGTGGSALTTVVAGRTYTTGISASGATINGTAYNSTFTLTGTAKDVAGTTFTSGNSNAIAWRSYDTNLATVNSSTGVVAVGAGYTQPGISGTKYGQVVLEARFPTFDTTDGNDFVYVHVIVSVYA